MANTDIGKPMSGNELNVSDILRRGIKDQGYGYTLVGSKLTVSSDEVFAIDLDKLASFVLSALSPQPAPNVEGSPLLEWAVERWIAQVKHRPLVNVHRRSLDDVWRQVIRWAGGDPDSLVGPSHDELLSSSEGRK